MPDYPPLFNGKFFACRWEIYRRYYRRCGSVRYKYTVNQYGWAIWWCPSDTSKIRQYGGRENKFADKIIDRVDLKMKKYSKPTHDRWWNKKRNE